MTYKFYVEYHGTQDTGTVGDGVGFDTDADAEKYGRELMKKLKGQSVRIKRMSDNAVKYLG